MQSKSSGNNSFFNFSSEVYQRFQQVPPSFLFKLNFESCLVNLFQVEADSKKNYTGQMIKKSTSYSDLAEISAILPTHGFNILTKFDEDWSKNFGIFISIIFLVLYNFFLISLYFKQDLCREREDDFEVQNMFCMKSYIESYRSHQLGGIGNLAIF